MTLEEIDAELARLNKQIVKITESPMPHNESGSDTTDDQSTEIVMDDQARAVGPEHDVETLWHRIKELEDLKRGKAA